VNQMADLHCCLRGALDDLTRHGGQLVVVAPGQDHPGPDGRQRTRRFAAEARGGPRDEGHLSSQIPTDCDLVRRTGESQFHDPPPPACRVPCFRCARFDHTASWAGSLPVEVLAPGITVACRNRAARAGMTSAETARGKLAKARRASTEPSGPKTGAVMDITS
jgi:hypothetical protein